jgi:hypothetical protein
MRRPNRARLATAIVIGTLALRSPPAAAAGSQAAAAEALFDEGLKLYDAGRYGEACDKFAESQRLAPARGTLLNVARCLEKTGKTATAWAIYREVVGLAHREGDAQRERVASSRESALRDHLASLSIVVPSESKVDGLVIKRDGTVIAQAEWGVVVPVDPGPHEVEISAPGHVARTDTVVVSAESKMVETVAPLALVDASPAPAPASAPVTNAQRAEEPKSQLGAQRVSALAAGAVGLLAVGAGAYFGAKASSRWSDAQAHCPQDRCDAAAVTLSHDAGTLASDATVAFVVAAVSLATGATLWLTAPTSAPSSTGARVRVVPTAGGAALAF